MDECSAHERRSSQPFLKLLHLNRPIAQETCVPSLKPLSSRRAETKRRTLQEHFVPDPLQSFTSC